MVSVPAIISDISFGLGLLNSFGAHVDVVGIYSNGTGANTLTSGLSSSVINSLLGTSPSPAFGQMFANARPMKATVLENSHIMEHPVENGSMISDFHVIDPVEILLPLVVSAQFYSATYAQIRQTFISATPLSVKTRTGVYSNMIIASMPHEEDPEMYDAITIGLRLRQVQLFVEGTSGTLQSNFQPADALDSNTIPGGLKQATALAGNLLTISASALSYASLARKF